MWYERTKNIINISVCFYLFCLNVLISIVSFCQWKVDMDKNDGIYYILVIKAIVETISFVTFILTRFDGRHGFQRDFVNEDKAWFYDQYFHLVEQNRLHCAYSKTTVRNGSWNDTRRPTDTLTASPHLTTSNLTYSTHLTTSNFHACPAFCCPAWEEPERTACP